MAVVTLELNKNGVRRITNGFQRPIKRAKGFFTALALLVDSTTQLTFRTLGKRRGRKGWATYNKGRGHILGGSTRMKSGTWRIRYGTDKSGRPGMQGILRKGIRRYSNSSKMLQASGGFRRSFGKLQITNKSMLYGTRMKIASQIMSNPPRPVLFVTNQDEKEWNRRFITFYNRGLKF